MNVEIYTDGSATTGDKPGGWAYVIVVDGVKITEEAGFLSKATNNVAEITAAIRGLERIQGDAQFGAADTVTLVSDSQLVLRYATGEYQCRKFHLVPLYCKLRQLHDKLNIQTRWVKGHNGDEHNERCDALAKAARESGSIPSV